MDNHLITVCIVHFKKLTQLKETVRSLEANTSSSIKIKILNQGYIDAGIKEYLEKLNLKENIEVIFNKTNTGCSPGRNLLSQNIKTPFIMMLDDDMYVNKGWDIPVMEFFKHNPEIGAIGFSIFKNNRSFWFTGGQSIILEGKIIRTNRLNIEPQKTSQKFIIVDDVCAGAMIYRKELEEIIPWDIQYFIGFEDLEKGIYFKKSKYKCAVSIQSKFIHDKVSEDRSFKDYNKCRRDYKALRNSYLHFLEKNGYRMILSRHIFYKHICLLPSFILRNFAYFWLYVKGKF